MRLVLAICCVIGLILIGRYLITPKVPYCQLADDDPHGIHLEYAPPQE